MVRQKRGSQEKDQRDIITTTTTDPQAVFHQARAAHQLQAAHHLPTLHRQKLPFLMPQVHIFK